MASYHFSVKSKNKGYALQHYLYISRLMQYEKVRQKSEEVLEHIEPGQCMPSWVKDPIEFWQAADTYERENAKVYMEYEIALPNELNAEQRKTLIEGFIEQNLASQHYPYSYAIHNVKSRINGEEQPHCHLIFSLKADDGIERTPEQYFKRHNAKEPSKGGAKKIQLQENHANYSGFLMHIRKQWENHLNSALAEHCPIVTYNIKGKEITLLNQVSADSYEKYNEQHGTLYLPEPKLGVGKQNDTLEYLEEIKKIRLHNQHEWEMEQTQKQFDQQHEYFYSAMNEPFSSVEVIHYIKHINQHAKNLDDLKEDLNEVIKNQNTIIQSEYWNAQYMNQELIESKRHRKADIEFNTDIPTRVEKTASPLIENSKSNPESKNDHKFSGYSSHDF